MTRRRKTNRLNLPPLAGFFGLAESDRGDPATSSPYPRITPSRVGPAVLPFRCYACKGINNDFTDARTREKYRDKREGKGHHWCPMCNKRFYLVANGMPLPTTMSAGATVGPSKVEHNGAVTMQDAGGAVSALIGAVFGGHASSSRAALGIDMLGANGNGSDEIQLPGGQPFKGR